MDLSGVSVSALYVYVVCRQTLSYVCAQPAAALALAAAALSISAAAIALTTAAVSVAAAALAEPAAAVALAAPTVAEPATRRSRRSAHRRSECELSNEVR